MEMDMDTDTLYGLREEHFVVWHVVEDCRVYGADRAE